jgi:NADPH:quinone reductase
MRAIAVTEYGGEPAVTELPKPEPARDKCVVRVEAAGMNPVDSSIAGGAYKDLMPATFPLVLGVDVAGVVEAVGAGTAGFEVGDRLFGQLLIPPLGSTGTYAEFVSVPKDAPVAKVPRSMDSVTAASLPTAGGTALQIAESLSPLEGKTMLIVGAAGGVGSFLTQFAVRAGARVIANVAARDSARVREYGAVETVDHHTDNVRTLLPRCPLMASMFLSTSRMAPTSSPISPRSFGAAGRPSPRAMSQTSTRWRRGPSQG